MKPKKQPKENTQAAFQRFKEIEDLKKKWEEDLEDFALRCFNLFSNEGEEVIKSVVQDICSDFESIKRFNALAEQYQDILRET